jgi:hypothetical protein
MALVVETASMVDAGRFDISAAEDVIIGELLEHGYRPVDPQKLTQIWKEKVRVAIEERDVAALRKLASQKGVSVVLAVRLKVDARQDILGVVYASTVQMAMQATSSGGNRIFGNLFRDRKPGYTPEEAFHEALDAVVRKAVGEMER